MTENETKVDIENSNQLKTKPKKALKPRETWGGKLDFLFSTTAYAVGLSNLWRFPYLCYKYGGGSFVLAYTIMLIFVGFPMYFLELILGQYSSVGSAVIFKRLCPIFSGIGYALWFSSILGNVAYSAVIGWTIFYLGVSFTDQVQWSNCNHYFNTENCVEESLFKECKKVNGSVYFNRTCFNSTTSILHNLKDITIEDRVSPEEEFFNIYVLNKTDGIDDVGVLQWRLLICVAVTWLAVLLCCVKGIRSSGKVVYITATFSYTVLIILLIRGLTLDGAMEGIKYFVTPRWEKLMNAGIWQEAAVQVFYSISIASGGLITMASYNKFNHNIIRDALIVPAVDFLINIIAGFSVFSVLGFMSKQLGKTIDDVANKGSGLAFITYAQAISRMPISPLWAVLFFLMLTSFGLDSMFGGVTNVVTGLTDEYPELRRKKSLVTIITCIASFLLTIPLVTGFGIYFNELIFSFLGWPKIIIAITEAVIVCYIYGIDRFLSNIQEMLNWSPGPWIRSHLQVILMTVSPGLLFMIFIMEFSHYEPYKSGDYVYPTWGNVIGWMIGLFPFVLILIAMIYKIFIQHKGVRFLKRMKIVFSPTKKWNNRSSTETDEKKIDDGDNQNTKSDKIFPWIVPIADSTSMKINKSNSLSGQVKNIQQILEQGRRLSLLRSMSHSDSSTTLKDMLSSENQEK